MGKIPRALKYILLVGGCVFALLVLAVVGLGAIFWWDLTTIHESKTTAPISREEAIRRHCFIPLPKSAHNIQYDVKTGGLQYCEALVRFEAPVADCHAFAQELFGDYVKQRPDHRRMPQFAAIVPVKSQENKKTPWFNPYTIANGVVAGGYASWEPRIWIDDDRGIFYYMVTD